MTRTLEGPKTVEAWEQSWALFSSAMVSLNQASPGPLAMYADGLRTLLPLFPGRWDTLLTTDIIVMTERWGRFTEQFELSPPAGWSADAPWDSVIAASAFSHAGPLAAWWQTHFVLPATLAGSSGGIQNLVDRVDQNVTARQHQPSREEPKKRPREERQQQPDSSTAICTIWNQRKGRCERDGPCFYGRRHVCDAPGCFKQHRSCDHHGNKKDGQPDNKRQRKDRKWKN